MSARAPGASSPPTDPLAASVTRLLEIGDDTALLHDLVSLLRPTRSQPGPAARFDALIESLLAHPELTLGLHDRLRETFGGARFVHSLAESGITSDNGFWHDLRARFARRFLPEPLPEHDLRSIVPRIFDHPGDEAWLRQLEPRHWIALTRLVVRPEDLRGALHPDLAAALLGLSQRVGALGIDEELNAQLHEVEDYDSPFLAVTHHAAELLEARDRGGDSTAAAGQLLTCVGRCRNLVRQVRSRKDRRGTSMRLTAVTRRLLQQLRRIELITHLAYPDDLDDFAHSLVPVFRNTVIGELELRSVSDLLRDHLDLVAHQVTEHTAKKGAKYISESPREYWSFLVAAMGGGAIVAVFAVFKTMLGALKLSLAAEALLYSLNYAVCFVLIYLTGAILATKQPAVTASTLARKMDLGGERAVEEVADTVVQVWRSQFVSFVGNLVCAFPFAMALSWGLGRIGLELADAEGAGKLLAEIHPAQSGALAYAAVAGVFLFAAGVITGWVDNQVLYRRLASRLRHAGSRLLDPTRRERVVAFVTDNAGVLAGNVALGFFLGCAGTVGVILGLPFDIRHIAFSSAHFGVAAHSAPQLLDASLAAWTAAGVFGIGFVNFVVSFGLTLLTTLESRQAGFAQWGDLARALGRRLARRPLAWLFPVGSGRAER